MQKTKENTRLYESEKYPQCTTQRHSVFWLNSVVKQPLGKELSFSFMGTGTQVLKVLEF